MDAILDSLLPKRCISCAALSPMPLCNECTSQIHVSPTNFSSSFSLFLYSGKIRDLIIQAKFEPNEGIARAFCRILKDWLVTNQPIILNEQIDCITFVPSHWRRRLVRGYDFPTMLARTVAQALRIPIKDLLRCTRYDPPLSSSASAIERQLMVTNRYALRKTIFARQRVLLVDDVITTGSTIKECSDLLEKQGAEVLTLSLAKVE